MSGSYCDERVKTTLSQGGGAYHGFLRCLYTSLKTVIVRNTLSLVENDFLKKVYTTLQHYIVTQ